MANFTTDWDTDLPSDSTNATQIDDYINNLRTDLEERLKNHIYGFVAGENDGVGGLIYGKFKVQGTAPTQIANTLLLYGYDVSSKCELHFIDEDGDATQITSGGKLLIGSGSTPQALMHNSTAEDGDGGRESQIRATGLQSGSESSTLGYIEIAHDGAADDQKGRCRIVLNDGDDDDVPSKVAIEYTADGAIDVTNSVSVLDEDDLDSDSAVKLATQQSIKAYIAAVIASEVTLSAATAADSEANDMLKAHAYLAATDGFVCAYVTGSGNGQYLRGYKDGTDDPAGAGEKLQDHTVQNTEETSICFSVAEGEYFEIITDSTNEVTIYWRSMGTLSAPVDQD